MYLDVRLSTGLTALNLPAETPGLLDYQLSPCGIMKQGELALAGGHANFSRLRCNTLKVKANISSNSSDVVSTFYEHYSGHFLQIDPLI